MIAFVLAALVLLVVSVLFLGRHIWLTIKQRLKKAGVQLAWGSITSTSVKSITVALKEGPLTGLTIDSVVWGSAARSRQATAGPSAADGSDQQNAASAWLPLHITGLRLIVRSHHGQAPTIRPKVSQRSKAHSNARAAATVPAVSTALAVAKRLLPQVPVQLQQVTVDFQGPGLSLEFKDVSLQWAVDEETSILSSTLLMQNLSLLPGKHVESTCVRSPASSVCCPLAKISIGVGPRRGLLPVGCTHLALQVGQVRVLGLSQLLVLANAAASPRKLAAVLEQSVAGSNGRLSPQLSQQHAAATTAPNKLVVPGSVADAVALLPDKVKLSFAGVALQPCTALPAEAEPMQALPQLQGSIGAVSLVASSCQQPAAVQTNGKLLSMSFSLGPVRLKAAAQAVVHESCSNGHTAVELDAAGATLAVDLIKATDVADKNNSATTPVAEMGPLQRHLISNQQPKEHQLKASCTCKITGAPSVKLHAHHIPALVQAAVLLQLSLQKLKQEQQVAANVGSKGVLGVTEEQLLPRTSSPSLSHSMSYLPRADTPTLEIPWSTGAPHTPKGFESSPATGMEGTASDSRLRPGPVPASPSAASTAAADTLQQRLVQLQRHCPVPAEYSGIMLEVRAAVENGIGIEVLDSEAAVTAWLSLQQLEGSVCVDWAPSPTSSNSNSNDHAAATAAVGPDKQRSFELAAYLNMQQLAIRVAPITAAAGRSAMQQLLLLDLVNIRASSADGSADLAAVSVGAAASAITQGSSAVACDVTLTAGQLKLTPSSETLAALLQLLEHAYVVPVKPVATALVGATSAAFAPHNVLHGSRKIRKHKQLAFASITVVVQSVVLSHTSNMPVCQDFARTSAAAEAAAKGLQSQLRVTTTTMQLSMQPTQQYIAASAHCLQIGYHVTGPSLQRSPDSQSIELLLMQGVEFRRYCNSGLQLLKVATQQLRSNIHVDAAVACAGIADLTLQQIAACAQQLQQRHATVAAGIKNQQAAVTTLAAAATMAARQTATVQAAQSREALATEDSFTALAGRASPDGGGAPLSVAAGGQQAHPPPLPHTGLNGHAQQQQQQQRQRPLIALEARLQDVAVQLSVCERDALLVQLELVKYSSVLEQCVAEEVQFNINDRAVIRIPHLAVHQLPGWMPLGATAAAAVLSQQQRACSPDRAYSSGHTAATPAVARHHEAGHKSWNTITPDEVVWNATADGSPGVSDQQSRKFDCSASCESVRFCEDGGVQNWQSIDDPAPSASLGSQRPANTKDPGLYQRQAARQQASRERCKVPSATAGSTGSAAVGTEVISLDVYAERVLFSVPHDEAPGRIILVCETWAKAVKQVLMTQVEGIQSSLVVLKAAAAAITASCGKPPTPAKAGKAKKLKPAYLELQAHLQQIVFCLEQNPLETWMGLHGPVLQGMAAERHLVEQLLASCSSAHGRISRTGGSGTAGTSKGTDAVGQVVQVGAVGGKTQRGQWQKRKWGNLGKRGAVTAAIASGSVTQAALAAAAGPAAAAMAAMAPGTRPLHQGLVSVQCQAPAATTAAAEGRVSDADGSNHLPLHTNEVAADAEVHSQPEAASDGEGPSHPAASGDHVDSESSEESDSSEEDDPGLIDADALAAVLPSNASALAGRGEAPTVGSVATKELAQTQDHVQNYLSAAAGEDKGSSEMQQAVLQAHTELFSIYKFRCRPLHAAADDVYHPSRAVMHISVAKAEAVVLICLPGHTSAADMAREVISRVDPASEGVVMERFQSISLDVGMQDIVAHFGGVEEMASTVANLGASGLLIRARQMCAPPQTRPMRMSVGTWHEADVPVVVKGTRPPMKMYTDVKAELGDVQGAFCPGLEAPFGQLNLAFKRITVPNFLNPDGSVPPSTHPGLPWWDMMGYMWRGVASVRIRGLTAVLANTQNPHVAVNDEKLALTAATLSIVVAAGKIDVTTTNMSALAHAAIPDAAPGDSLLVLPAFHLPLVTLTFSITNKLPSGRNPLLHHCFPIHARPPGPDAPPQDVVDVFSLMRSEGWCLGIDIAVNSDKTPTAGTAVQSRAMPGFTAAYHGTPGGSTGAAGFGGAAKYSSGFTASSAAGLSGVAASCWHYYQPYSIPHAFIGEFQIKYIIEMVDTLANPTAVVRLSRKLKPFYARDWRPEAAAAAKALAVVRAQIVQMPLLKQKVDISLTADVFRVHHDAQDSEDPSDMVYIALSSVRYMNTFTYSRYQRTQQLSNGTRVKDSMRQFMASLTVEAYDLKIVKPQGDQLSAMLCGCAHLGGQPGAAVSGLQTPTGGRKPAAATTAPGHADQVDRVRHMLDPKTSPRSGTGGSGVGSPSRGSPLKGHLRDTAGTFEEDNSVPGFSQGLIAAAACFLLRQAPAEVASGGEGASATPTVTAALPVDPPPVPKRPIHMIAQDVKLLCPAELRDTLMLLFHHMQKAFTGISFGQPRGPARINTKKQQQQQQQAGTSGTGAGMGRARSDGLETGGNLGRSSVPVGSGAAGSSAGGPATRRASTDAAVAACSADAGGTTSAGGTAGAPAVSGGNSSMVSTPLEEEVMLQKILQENQAAAAASKARVLADERARSAGDLSAGSTGSRGSGTVGADAAESAAGGRDDSLDMSEAAGGAGHAAVAVRAVTGAAGLNKPVLSVSTAAEDVASDSASRVSADGTSPRQQPSAAGSFEEALLEYEIQFVQVQVNLVSDSARGSLVLGTNSAQLLGHLNVSKLERSVSFKMDQVQAHVVCSEKDPQQGPLWLEIANGKLSTPPGAEAIMRQVLLPFKCQLVTTKQATDSATAAALSSSTQPQLHSQQQQQQQTQQRPDRNSSGSGLPPAGFAPSAAQELRLHVPTIGARLDSRQFEVLVDVIQNIAMAPLPAFPPSVRSLWRHPDGTSEDDDNQDVQYALETLQSLRERQRGLEQELVTVWQAQQHYQQLQQQYARLVAQHHSRNAERYLGNAATRCDDGSNHVEALSEYSSNAVVSSGSAPRQQGLSSITLPGNNNEVYKDVREAATALVTALAQAGAVRSQHQLTAMGALHRLNTGPAGVSNSSSSLRAGAVGGGRGPMMSLSRGNSAGAVHSALGALQQLDQLTLVSEREILVWWAQEQLQGALDAITASRVVLNLLRTEAGLLKVRQRDSMGVGLTVDTIDWALSKGNTVIVQGELQGISYQSIRSEDHTGTTKIQLHTATFRDPKAAAAAAAGSSSSSSKGHGSCQPHNVSEPPLLDTSSMHGTAGTGSAGSSSSGALVPGQCPTPRELRESAASGSGALDSSDAGVILAPWNPDESWERDELVRIYAIHGALEKRHVVYEHIEVLVHPIRVHLTAALASALQDYFNLRDEDSKLQNAAVGKGSRHAAIRDDKRRATAPGDLLATPGNSTAAVISGTTPSSGKSRAAAGSSSTLATSSSTVGPLTAAAPRNRPSIFHRRAAAAAAAAHSSVSVAGPAAPVVAANSTLTTEATGGQPQIVVPPIEMGEVAVPTPEHDKTSSLAAADSPATEVPFQLPAPGLGAPESAAAHDPSHATADHADDAARPGSYSASFADESGHCAAGASVVAPPPSPGPCVQPVSAEAALTMRYGSVLRGRAGRAAASTPSTPVGSAGGAVGAGAFASAAGGAGGSSGGHGPSAVGAGSGTMNPGSTAAGGPLTPGAAAAVKKPARSIMFKHVRFNRMHARLTYEGPPLSINGFGLVLDNRVYRNIDGGWTTVLNRYKWDAIRSLVKSFSGLQARKLQELQIPNYGAEPPDTMDALRSSSGFKAGLMSLLKGKRPAGGAKLRLNSGDSIGVAGGGGGGYGGLGDDADGSVREGSAGGVDEAAAGGVAGLGGGSDYVVLMRDALRAKHKAKKVALLLGNVPPLPQQAVGMEV